MFWLSTVIKYVFISILYSEYKINNKNKKVLRMKNKIQNILLFKELNMPGFTIIPNEERDLSRYHRSNSNIQQEEYNNNSSSKIEEFKNEIDELVRQFRKDNEEADLEMRKAFEETDRKYEDATRSIRSKYPDLENLRSKYPDLDFYLGI